MEHKDNTAILVVDDDKEIADLVEIHLVGDGYTVFKAYDAMEGLKILSKEKIKLAVLDIMMPGIDGIEMLIRQGKLEVQHLGFIRGRDIKNSIIICSEAENLTKQHVQLLIGRVGEGSNLWLDGDFKQTDAKVFEENNGLNIAIDKLKGHPLFGYVHLEKSERSETSALADLLD